jgi:surface antigen
MFRSKAVTALISAAVIGAFASAALADPPSHAPAHGWRKKHDPYYRGYSGVQWEEDYEVSKGRCNREAIATVVGGVVGGAIANRVGDEHPVVATVIGAALGALIGNKIGEKLDEADKGCVGHALEIAKPGQVVTWTNAATGVRYEMTPRADRSQNGTVCREFKLNAATKAEKSATSGLACKSRAGVWQIQS